MPRAKEKAISRIDLMILGLLSERPMHGYEISRVLDQDKINIWIDIPIRSVYASLSKLKRHELVRETVEKESGKRERTVFHITNKGRQEFLAALFTALGRMEAECTDDNIPILFMNRLAFDKVVEALNRKKELMKNWLASIEKVVSEGTEDTVYSLAVLRHTKLVGEARLRWLDGFIQSLTKKGGISEAEFAALPKSPQTALRGSLVDTALPDIIHLVDLSKRTGNLILQKDHLIRSIFFRNGRVVAATSFSSDKKMKKTETGNQRRAQKTLQDILETFNWSDGEFVFQEGATDKGMVPLDITNKNLIFAGCSIVDEESKISKIIPSTEVIFDRVEGTQEIVENLQLAKDNKNVLTLINGVRDVQTIARMADLSIFETNRILYAMVNAGILTTVSKDKAEVLRLFKYITAELFDRMKILRVKKPERIEEGFNSLAERASLPFRVKGGTLSESVESGLALSKLIEYEKMSLEALVGAVDGYIGKSFTDEAARSIVESFPSDLEELFSRFEFAGVLLR